MSNIILGIDFGTHSTSLAIWYEEKNFWEVLADDLGFRTIPCAVAFRADEQIVGHSAVNQQHKNANNTFSEVRNFLFSTCGEQKGAQVNVPAIEKDLQSEELVTIFFRYLHNQVKQQVGKPVREAVVTIPTTITLDEDVKKKFVDAAQAGGIRIKSFIHDSTAALLAYGFDEPTLPPSVIVTVDLGWSHSTVSLYNVSSGLFVPLSRQSSTQVSGKIFVKLLVDFCAKEFTRKHKIPCVENKKAMIRLHRECEGVLKALSTGQEASIDIDSFCEGIDLSMKVSRARFEDIISIPIIHFKNLLASVTAGAKIEPHSVHHVCLAGGPSAIPRLMALTKQYFPEATFPKVRFETFEAQCIGAVIHGKNLVEQTLLDNAPTASPQTTNLLRPLLWSATAEVTTVAPEIFSAYTNLPCSRSITCQLPANQSTGSIFLGYGAKKEGGDSDPKFTLLGELVVTLPAAASEATAVNIDFEVSVTGEISAKATLASNQEEVVGSVTIPAL